MRSFGECKWCGAWRELKPEQLDRWPTCLVCVAQDEEWDALVRREWEDAVSAGEYDDVDALAEQFWRDGLC